MLTLYEFFVESFNRLGYRFSFQDTDRKYKHDTHFLAEKVETLRC